MGCPTSGGPPLEDAQSAGVQNLKGEEPPMSFFPIMRYECHGVNSRQQDLKSSFVIPYHNSLRV